MSRKPTPVPIQRGDGDSPHSSSRHRAALERAKARGRKRKRPEDMQGTPRFDEAMEEAKRMRPAPGFDQPLPSGLSKETQDGLEAMAAATAVEPATKASIEDEEDPEFTLEEIQDIFGISRLDATSVETVVYPSRFGGETDRLRHVVEKRCGPIDIGQYLMNGFVVQKVEIIEPGEGHKGLWVAFRTIPDALEVYIDKRLSEEAAVTRAVRREGKAVDAEMSQREYGRRASEWALAAYLDSYQGKKWPKTTKEGGEVSGDAMQQRLDKVRTIPSHFFNLLSNNLGWFIDRSMRTITAAVLGNG